MRNHHAIERIKGYGTAGLSGILAGAMLAYPLQAADAARNALTLWAKAVAPVLGPFMVCMLMISSRLQGGNLIRVGMAWLCGSPGGAKIFQGVPMRRKTALRYAAMTGTMSPMFFLGTVAGWLQSPAAGWAIFCCHLAGAYLTGLLLRLKEPAPAEAKVPAPVHAAKPLSLPAALQNCAPSLCVIALCMMLGSAAARMVQCALPRLPSMTAAILQCLLEVTAGAQALIALHPPRIAPMICAACSFSGLSILLQNASCWQESGLTVLSLLPLRLIHAAISGVLCLMLSIVFPHIFACAF